MKKLFTCILTVLMLSAVMPSSFAAARTGVEGPAFSDVSGHWAEKTILKFSAQGIVKGYPDGTFCPDKVVTRAEAATIIVRALESAGKKLEPINAEEAGQRGWYKTHNGPECVDVNTEAWYFPYVAAAETYFPMWLPSDAHALEPLGPYDESSKMQPAVFFPDAGLPRCHLAEILVELKFWLYDMENIADDADDGHSALEHLETIYKDPTLIEHLGSIANKYGIPNNWSRMRNYIWLAYKYDVMTGDPDGYFRPYDGVTRAQLVTALDNILNSGNAAD